MNESYAKLIEELDKNLKLMTAIWIEASPEAKPKLNERINQMLDERLRLMKIRDETICETHDKPCSPIRKTNPRKIKTRGTPAGTDPSTSGTSA